MLRAGSGISELRDGVRAAQEAASRALTAAGVSRADAMFVFMTTEHAGRYGEILGTLAADYVKPGGLSGCSAAGVLTDRGEREAGPAVAVLAAAGPKLRIEAGFLPEAHPPGDLGLALGHLAKDAPLIVLFPALDSFEPRQFFGGLESTRGFVPVIGGAPSGRGRKFYQFADGQAAESRTATALVRGGTHVEIGVAQGCRPIGRAAVITKAENGTIRGLASKPAVEMLAHALEDAGIDDVESATTGIFAGIAIDPRKHPLERGDFLVRPIVGLDSDTGAISVGERVGVGQTLVFQLRDRSAASADLDAMLDELARRTYGRKPRFGLYFDCMGRGKGLFGEPDHDIRRIGERFPGMPLAGFFGNGEIAPIGGRNFLHTYTGVLAVFCEPEGA